MVKTYELVMPANYVELTEDEMMYLDGGRWLPRSVVGAALDIAILITPLGAGYAPLKYLTKTAATAMVKKYAPQLASKAAWALAAAFGMVINTTYTTILNTLRANAGSFTSLGGIVAYGLDAKFHKGVDGWIA